MGEAANLIATEGSRFSADSFEDLKFLSVLQNRYTHSDKRLTRYYRLVAHHGINSEETVRFNNAATGNHHV